MSAVHGVGAAATGPLLVHLGTDLSGAEQYYAHVDRLAPRGFFTCKTSLDGLRRELAGER
jgi:hypothetical protein